MACCTCFHCFAQQDSAIRPSVKVIACVQKNNIVLRWGTNQHIAWKYANQYGYMVERYTLVQKGKVLSKPIIIKITQEPVKPQPLSAWEEIAKKDKYAAIAAQALYGKTFDMNVKGGQALDIVNQVQEQETRFSFAMFCADQSLDVANKMGLKLSDKFIFSGERYLYKVYTLVPKTIMNIDTGFVFVDAGKLQVLPAPLHVIAEFGDKVAMLSWDNIYQDIYSSYYIERSSNDGASFERLNEEPYLTSTPRASQRNDKIFMMDSLPENNKNYSYRIRGKSYFGELGPPSAIVKGKGIAKPKALPTITAVKIINNAQAILKWEFPKEMNDKIAGFQLATASSLALPLQNMGKLIPPDKREWVLDKLQTSGYYGIKAIDAQGNEYPSAPYLVQLKDSLPPAAPSNLKGKIDTLGLVSLSWKRSPEADIEGYRVYMANSLAEEFSQVTSTPAKDTVFTYKISLHTLSEKVYFKIVALDHHFNISPFSSILGLARPDTVAPARPVISNCNSIDSAVVIQYLPSSSKDVVKHTLLRKAEGSDQWVRVADHDSTNKTHQYIDKGSDVKTIFYYTIEAKDLSGNTSVAVQPAVAKRFDNFKKPNIEKATAQADRVTRAIVISWQYAYSGVSRILLYRAEENGSFRLYKTLSAENKFYQDKAIKIGTTYKYILKASYTDGGSSPMSKEMSVRF